MTVTLNPYLNFNDQARAALEFYHSVFGGTLNVSTFADFGQARDPSDAEKIMHGQLEGDNGLVLMAADTPSHLEYRPAAGFSVSLSGDDDQLIPNSLSKEMADGIPGAKLTILSDCGHCPQAERPEATAAALTGWMQM